MFLRIFDACAVSGGHMLAALALVAGVLYGATSLVGKSLERAGLLGGFFHFCMQECHKSPRKFWAVMLWGSR